MNTGAAAMVSLVMALIAGFVGGPGGRGAKYGGIVAAAFMAIGAIWGARPSDGMSTMALVMAFGLGAFQGLCWGTIWGLLGGFIARAKGTTPSSKPGK